MALFVAKYFYLFSIGYDQFHNHFFHDFKSAHEKKSLRTYELRAFKEAQTGFEPVDTGVADHCLTAWLLRRACFSTR